MMVFIPMQMLEKIYLLLKDKLDKLTTVSICTVLLKVQLLKSGGSFLGWLASDISAVWTFSNKTFLCRGDSYHASGASTGLEGWFSGFAMPLGGCRRGE